MNQPNLQQGGDAIMRGDMPVPKELTSPEPAQAKVGAEFKPTGFESRWANVANCYEYSEISYPISRAIRGAVEEATATLRAELAEAKRHLADARFAQSVERIQFDKANAQLAKAKASARQCADSLGILRGSYPFRGWENGEGESIDELLESAYQSASAIAASKE